MEHSRWPDFVIAGAPKCGSFTLYHYLSQHPDIKMSRAKEPSVYHNQYDKYNSAEIFEGATDHQILGDGTIGYFTLPHVPKRIHEENPNTKLIFIFRSPSERTWSHFWHRQKKGLELRKWKEILTANDDDDLIAYSRYYSFLQNWLQYFKLSDMHFIVMEEFSKNEDETMQNVFEFLGVEPFTSFEKELKNKGYAAKSARKNHLIAKIRKADWLKNVLPESLRNKGSQFLKKLRENNKVQIDKDLFQPEDKAFLKQRFEKEVVSLEKLLNRKLPWE